MGNAYSVNQIVSKKKKQYIDNIKFNELEYEVAMMEICQKQYFEEIVVLGDNQEYKTKATVKSLINEINLPSNKELLSNFIDVNKYIKRLQAGYSKFKDVKSREASEILDDLYFIALFRSNQTQSLVSRVSSVNRSKIEQSLLVSKMSNIEKMRYSLHSNIPQGYKIHDVIKNSSDDEVFKFVKECSIASGFRVSFVLSAYAVNLVSIKRVQKYDRRTADQYNRFRDARILKPQQRAFFTNLIMSGYHVDKEKNTIVMNFIKKIRNKMLMKNVRLVNVTEYERLLKRDMIFKYPKPSIKEDRDIKKITLLCSKGN